MHENELELCQALGKYESWRLSIIPIAYQSKKPLVQWGLSTPKRCQECRQVRKQTLVPDTEVRHDNH